MRLAWAVKLRKNTDFVGRRALEKVVGAPLKKRFAGFTVDNPEIVLLGTGLAQHFPHPRLTAALANARVGIEVMDTRAACRTFNILIAEDRRVVAALIVG